MTIFGPDISSYQSGLALSRLADASFVIAKTTEGTYYTDADYQAWRGRRRARQAVRLVPLPVRREHRGPGRAHRGQRR